MLILYVAQAAGQTGKLNIKLDSWPHAAKWIGRCMLLDSRSNGLGFDSHCWPCVEMLRKLLIPYIAFHCPLAK